MVYFLCKPLLYITHREERIDVLKMEVCKHLNTVDELSLFTLRAGVMRNSDIENLLTSFKEL